MKTKLTDTPDYSNILDFNHHDLVNNIAIFTAHAPFCCCSRVVSGFTVKVRQAPTSYLLVHLTNSTTPTAYIQRYFTWRFCNSLLFTSSEDPLLSSPTHCRRAAVSRISDQPPNCTNSLPPLLQQRRCIFKLSCTAYGVRELHDYWCLPPRSLVVVYFGREVSTTVTSVVKCSMLTLL